MSSKIKVKENKSERTLSKPQFTLSLQQTNSLEQQLENSYEALSKLIEASDVIIDLNSSLTNLPIPKREPYAFKFLDSVKALGLEYKYSATASNSSPSFLSGLFGGNKNIQEHHVLVYVPHEIWVMKDFEKLLPLYGARYFILKENSDGLKALEDLQKMLDSEKLGYFKLIIFSVITFNSMGIFSKYLNLSEIKKILEINE
jgi:hypothetical protein